MISSADQPLVSVQDLAKTFTAGRIGSRTEVRAVDGVTFDIGQGSSFGLVGESGSGKTTTARMILRLLQPDGGRVIFNGADIASISGGELQNHRRQVQAVFQDP